VNEQVVDVPEGTTHEPAGDGDAQLLPTWSIHAITLMSQLVVFPKPTDQEVCAFAALKPRAMNPDAIMIALRCVAVRTQDRTFSS